MKRAAEPPVQRWIKRPLHGDDPGMAHLLNFLSVSVVFYTGVTRGGLAFARVLERVVRL